MSIERNVSLVRRYFTECVSGATGPDQASAVGLVDELVSAEFAMFYNNDEHPYPGAGPAQHKQFLVEHARNFPVDRWTIEAIVADDNVVACQWHFEATHGETGNPVDVRAADFFSVRDGRLVELRRFLDFDSFEKQLEPRTGEPPAD